MGARGWMSGLAGGLLLIACDGAGTAGAPTFHGDVRPILDANCVECHQAGGIGPTDFTDEAAWAQGAPSWAAAVVASVESGLMPPWKPRDDCHPLANARTLSDADKDTLSAWAAADYPLGKPESYEASTAKVEDPMVSLGTPDRVLAPPVRYTPDPGSPDDYRCFVVDDGVDVETWIQGLRFAPDAVEMVHHAILYRLDAQYADLVAELEADDADPGYTCFGSPGTWNTDTLAAWAPGQVPERYPDGVARKVDQGSLLILQLHYNLLNVDPDAVPDDATAIELWTLPTGETPSQALMSLPLANQSIRIPPGDPGHVERDTTRFSLPEGFSLPAIGVMPHMHRLGTRIRLNRIEEDETRTCVFEIPEWDFDWQQTYFFPEDNPVQVDGSVKVEVVCEYDNSAANQPVVNGVQQEPQEVRWGDGTLDEMCLIYINALVPPAFLE